MIALWIILGVLLLIFLLLMIRVQVHFRYDGEPHLTMKVLFYKKTLIPSPPKHEKKKPAPKKQKEPKEKPAEQPQEKKQSYLAKIREKKGLSGLVSLLTSVARIAAGALKGLFSHIVIRKMDVGVALNSGNAADTAVTYGKLCSVIYPAVNVIVAATVCKSYNVSVEPVFDAEGDTEVSAEVSAYLRLIYAVHEAIKAGLKLLWLRIRL